MDIDTENKENVLPFEKPKLILSTGGATTDENWLANIEEGTVFLAKEKSMANRRMQPGEYSIALELYMLQDMRDGEVAELVIKTPDQHQLSVWVSTLEFSRKKELVKILGKVTLRIDPNIEEDIKDPIDT